LGSPGGYRLHGGRGDDHARRLTFTFNGRTLEGRAGDTLAAALIASGVRVIGRSLKYHRPRGFFGTGTEDPNAIVSVRDGYGYDPAVCAGTVQLVEGLDVRTVTGWPSTGFDVGAVASLSSRLLGAGFYYKTFMWPGWHWFEPLIRRATGFGTPRRHPNRRTWTQYHDSCDVLIVGGGPAGLAAARALAGTGMRIVLADDQRRLGGSLGWEDVLIDGMRGRDWADSECSMLRRNDTVTILPSTTVAAAYDQNFFALVQSFQDDEGVSGQRLWRLRARHVVLATGLIDRPLVFQNNDRPGVMLSGAVRRLVGEYAVAPAARVAVYTNNDSGYGTALAAARAGIEVAAVVDTRRRSEVTLADETESMGIICHFESGVVNTRGYKGLQSITVAGRDGRMRRETCSALAVTGGWTPLIHLAAHRGAYPSYDHRRSMFLCREAPDSWHIVGGAAGSLTLKTAISQGLRAAEAISKAERHEVAAGPILRLEALDWGSVKPVWGTPGGRSHKKWVDLHNDVKMSDIETSARENYVSVEHLKRYTTLGMGIDQGKTSNVNGLGILASVTGRSIDSVGTTTFRPMYIPVSMQAIAGRRQRELYRPRRYMPAHEIHRAADAVFNDFGWDRPDWYRINGRDRESAVAVEMAAVRHAAGVFDASPLGKIEVTGPDAGAFLNRFYVSNLSTLKPGRVRYSVMLRDDGVVFDDGVVTCVADNHYIASPTSGQAEAVVAWFERWRQIEWPWMRVAISPVTSSWAAIAIAGPSARELLARLEPDIDVSAEAFRHMHFREGHVADVPARVARVSFTGEVQFEIAVPARWGESLLKRVIDWGTDLGVRHVGMEAWLRLRLEKGYIHLGADTNGRTTPDDIGMGSIARKKRSDFIGKRSLSLAFNRSPHRETLVGLRALDGALEVGGRVLSPGSRSIPCGSTGYVTSACYSPSLRQSIALALVEGGDARNEETVRVYCSGKIVSAQICAPCFYDPENQRLNA
jgi:sarcosine oxidase subunit alpha